VNYDDEQTSSTEVKSDWHWGIEDYHWYYESKEYYSLVLTLPYWWL